MRHGLKKKHDVNNLRVFGCEAYLHVPDEKRKKLDKKSIPCIFVGYPNDSKGYRLYNLIADKMILSRENFNYRLSTLENDDPSLLVDDNLLLLNL